jgi:hypothetical protein
MSVLDYLRKGFGFVLLSMGVSRPQENRELPKRESPKQESPKQESAPAAAPASAQPDKPATPRSHP